MGMLLKRNKILRPRELSTAGLISSATNPAGYSVPVSIDNVWPISRIDVLVNVTVSTLPLQATGVAGFCADALANVLKRVRLEAFEPSGTRTVVDASGVALIERGFCLEGMDYETGRAMATAYMQGGSDKTPQGYAAQLASYKIRYPIFLAHPRMVDPLAAAFLLPVHLMKDKPKLTLEFASASEMANAKPTSTGSASIAYSSLSAILDVQYAQMNGSMEEWIASVGGYARHNFMENEVTCVNSTTQQEIKLPSPGKYIDFAVRGYTNETNNGFQIRGWPADSSNPTWWLDRAGERLQEFDPALLDLQNSALRNENTGGTGSNAATWPTRLPGYYRFDFLSPGAVDVNELGSLVNTDLANNVDVKLIGSVTGASYAKIRSAGWRIEGNTDRFKASQSK
jgi:hypothetical protein